MATLPALKVEMAFANATGSAFPVGVYSDRTAWTWFDVSQWVRSVDTSLGRQHELDRTEASNAQIVLDNRDGRFSPWNTTSYTWDLSAGGTVSLTPASVELITVPVRITATWSATTYNVFYGYVDAWQPNSPDALNQETTVACSDVLRQLSLRRLSNATLYPNQVITSVPYGSGLSGYVGGYFRCNDANAQQGLANSLPATVGTSYTTNAAVTGSAAFQQPGAMAYDPNDSIDLGAGRTQPTAFISVGDWKDIAVPTVSDYCIEAWVKDCKRDDYLLANYLPGTTTLVGVHVDTNGKAELVKRVFSGGGSTDTTLITADGGATITDRNWHLVTFASISDTWYLYVDGYLVGSVASGTTDSMRVVTWGAWATGTSTSALPYASTYGLVDELVVTGDPTGSFAAACSTRYEVGSYLRTDNEYVGTRILKALTIAGVVPYGSTLTTAPLNLSQGYLCCMGEQADVTSQAVLDYIIGLAESEQGYFYQGASGTLHFRNRFYPQEHAGTGKTISDGAVADGRYTLNPEIVLDDLDTWNIAQMTDPTGNTTEVTNQASSDKYGPRTFNVASSWGERPEDQQALGQMITYRFANPRVRMARVTLDHTYTDPSGVQANLPLMLGLYPWDSLTLVRSGSASTALTASVVVERISHRYEADPGRWSTEFMLSPYEMIQSATPDNGSVFRLSDNTTTYSHFKASGQDVFGG